MIGIGAFFACVVGLLLLLIHFDTSTLAEAGIGRGTIQLVGFIFLAIGLLEFLLIYALWDGSNTARIITSASFARTRPSTSISKSLPLSVNSHRYTTPRLIWR